MNRKRFEPSVQGGEMRTNTSDSERQSRSILSDKLTETFTLCIHYANHNFFAALPSRNHQVVNGNHTSDYVIVTLQQPQAKLRLLPRCFEGCKFSLCKRNDLRN